MTAKPFLWAAVLTFGAGAGLLTYAYKSPRFAHADSYDVFTYIGAGLLLCVVGVACGLVALILHSKGA